jgi:8-oxo-dGTP diphosphatase
VSGALAQIVVAAGVLVLPGEKVLIAQRRPGSHMEGAWEFPGGKVAPAEMPLDGLVRELDEELGIRVRYARHLMRFTHTYPEHTVDLHIWRVLSWDGEPHGCEGQPLRRVRLDELGQAGLLPADDLIINALMKDAAVNELEWNAFATAVTG